MFFSVLVSLIIFQDQIYRPIKRSACINYAQINNGSLNVRNKKFSDNESDISLLRYESKL